MKKMIAALLVVAVGLGVNTATAAFFSGNDLQDMCGKGSYVCTGYIMGVGDAEMTRLKRATGDQCVPETATGGQLQKIVEKWLDENPQHLHHEANLLITNAIIDAFNCDTGQRWVLDN